GSTPRKTELFDFDVQRATRDLQSFCRSIDSTVVQVQRVFDHPALGRTEGSDGLISRARKRISRWTRALGRHSDGLDCIAACKQGSPFQGVAEFAEIAGPGMILQRLNRRLGKPGFFAPAGSTKPIQHS